MQTKLNGHVNQTVKTITVSQFKNYASSSDQVYDLCVIGSGPGGYVAAIKAAQLGLKVTKKRTGERALVVLALAREAGDLVTERELISCSRQIN